MTFFFLFLDPLGLPLPLLVVGFDSLPTSEHEEGMKGRVLLMVGGEDVVCTAGVKIGTSAGLTSGGCKDVTIKAVPELLKM